MAAQNTSVCVRGLDTDIDRVQLDEMFAFAGEITHSIMVRTDNGKFSGTAYIVFRDAGSVARAIRDAPDNLTVTVPVGTQLDELRAFRGHVREEPASIGVDALMAALKMMSASDRVRIADVLLGMDTDTKPRRESAPAAAAPPIYIQEQPKLSFFSGEKGKDTTFARWRYDVNCLLGSYPEASILQAIRKSLRTPAADVVRHLGESASIEQIIKKLHSMYGTVLSGEAILQKFYSEPQTAGESCAQWAARAEELCYQALEKNAIAESAILEMLKSRFWNGLRDEKIKSATRHIWKSLTFNDLLGEVRAAEEEYSTPTQAQQISAVEGKSELQLQPILKTLQAIESRLDRLEKTGSQKDTTKKNICNTCKKEGHLSYGCRQNTDIRCNRCNDIGHIARACRRQNLN